MSGFLGDVTLPGYLGISAGVVGFIILLIALGGFVGAGKLEKRFSE